jgi:phosphoribosyl 1,2-cyclic phosphodiesterase
MHLVSIGSSSSGNSTLVYNDDTHVLIDSGVPVKTILERTGRKSFDALFLTHEHSDHVKSAGALHRKTKTPIYVNPLVKEKKPTVFGNVAPTIDIFDSKEFVVGSMKVRPFSTKHDAVQSLGFVFEDATTRFGYVTDTGSISKTMRVALEGCKSIMIECDYDEELLAEYEGYTIELKDRIASNFGHLSNQQGLEFIQSLGIDDYKVIVIGHLSERTNSPAKLRERIVAMFPNPEHQKKFHIAPFDGSLEL